MSNVKLGPRTIRHIYAPTFAFTGVGCSFVGPFLPMLLVRWRLHDHHAGLLPACLFLGSLTGTLCISSNLLRTVLRGSWCALVGMLLFAACTVSQDGFSYGAISLALLGFGLGQLMSSMNIILGSGEPSQRSNRLARGAAAWCAGAIVSPLLTTGQIGLVPAWRLAAFALLFTLPVFHLRGSDDSAIVTVGDDAAEPERYPEHLRAAALCVLMFVIYGGVESSIGAWIPLFGARYQLGSSSAAHWVVSLFWCGLILGRLLMVRLSKPEWEKSLLHGALIAAAVCLLVLIVAPSSAVLWVTCAAVGVSLGPVFPLMLSAAIRQGFRPRTVGVILAGCGLGAAIFPAALGLVSSAWSLRMGMLVPFGGLGFLVLMQWPPRLREARVVPLLPT